MARRRDSGERSPLLGVGPGPRGRGAGRVAVLVVEALGGVAFFSISSSLGLYLSSGSTLGWGATQASQAAVFFLAASDLLSPVGGWLADVYLGRCGSLVLSLSLCLLVGCVLPLTATLDGRLSLCGQLPAGAPRNCSWQRGGTCQGRPPELYCAPTVYTSLLVLALGVSSVKANLSPFGAEQVREQGGDATGRFFNWFYWSTNIGAVFSLLLVAFVQQHVSFLASCLIPVACLALALLIFLLATPTFIIKPPRGSQVSSMIKLALRNLGCAWLGDTRARLSTQEAEDPLPSSRAQPGGPSPEEDLANFQALSRVLPVLLTFIPYWMVYSQIQATYQLQALHLHIPSTFQHGPYSFPAAWLLLANLVVLLALVPLKNHIINPFLARRKLLPSALGRVALGTFFSLTSILTAGFLERERLRYVRHSRVVPQLLGKDLYMAATLPVWWQVPQHLLLSISQLLVSISRLEFACTEAPRSMKGALMGLFCFTSGLGFLLGEGLLALLSQPTHGWMHCPKDPAEPGGSINHCRLDNYFFLLVGIQLVNCLLFIWISKHYQSHPALLSAPHPSMGPEED